MRMSLVLLALSSTLLAAQGVPVKAPGDASTSVGAPVRKIGGSVSAPIVVFAPEPTLSEASRAAAASGTAVNGNVLVNMRVDVNGNPTHVRVLHGIGMGLDEKAVEAVRQYKFKPAMENGVPVPVEMNVEVHFEIISKGNPAERKPPIQLTAASLFHTLRSCRECGGLCLKPA